MKIDSHMNLDRLRDCMTPNGKQVTEEQARRMRDLLNRDAVAYGWSSTGDVEDVDWHRMQEEAARA